MPIRPESPDPQAAPPKKASRPLTRLLTRDARDHLWAFLDLLDARPFLKRLLIFGLPVFLVATALGVWGYGHWARTNSLRIARQWLDAGRLDRAAIAVGDALTSEPGLPASWRLASELAWRKGNRAAATDYARKAALVSQYKADDVLAWAEAAILNDDVEQAAEAESYLDPAAQASSRALRLSGEVARRRRHFQDARDKFEAALKADAAAGMPSPAIDEIPLGIVSLQTGSTADGERGRALLQKWSANANWGAEALRALLVDAEARHDGDAIARWGEALRIHPRCTLGDIPVCLKAFEESDPARYRMILAQFEGKNGANPTEAAQLIGWLNEIGQSSEAVRWGQSLDPAMIRKPPVLQGVAEGLRKTGRWSDLADWVDHGDWGQDVGFMGWGYGLLAARHMGDEAKAASLWQTLYDDGRSSPAHALFLGDSLYSWGYPKDAATLLWSASERPDLAYQALGTLARLYQVQRDSVGEYRAFSRLNAIRPSDRRIANNFAYFAAVTSLGSQTQVQKVAEDNFNHEPANIDFRSTYAFVLVWSGQASQAMTVMEPVSRDWKKSPAIAFAYGAALAGVGRKPEAKEIFDSLNSRGLTPQESDWIKAALR
jgi:tetratricopeptide (TPR) repeat protein